MIFYFSLINKVEVNAPLNLGIMDHKLLDQVHVPYVTYCINPRARNTCHELLGFTKV